MGILGDETADLGQQNRLYYGSRGAACGCLARSAGHHRVPTDTHMPSTQVRSADMVEATMHTILDVLRWSLTALSDGLFCDKRFGLSQKYYGLDVGCNTWFWAGRKSSTLGVWTALHGGPQKQISNVGGEPPPTFGNCLCGRRGRPDHKNQQFPADPKTMH